ncbi:MAG: hypothetical protein QHH07_06295 [Sedimentisphaerales bacterium]|nr:hypothetical protein [Sedimentisphaerales bacterium]
MAKPQERLDTYRLYKQSRPVRYLSEDPAPVTEYVLQWIFQTLGLRSEQVGSVPAAGVLDLYYGNRKGVTAGIKIPIRETDVLWDALIKGKVSAADCSGRLDFDIIGAIARFITDKVNAGLPLQAYDPHGRLLFAHSFQAKAGLATIPVVNLYISFLRELIAARLGLVGVPLWPSGKTCAIGLSHDVDVPEVYAVLQLPSYCRGKGLSWHLSVAKRKAKAYLDWIRKVDPEQYWCFDQIMEEEAKRGFKSTFFFSAVSRACKWASGFDVDYDITQPQYRQLFKRIKANGFEIGLHASYNACRSADILAAEKRRLEDVAETQVLGVRHHFWHLGTDPEQTLAFHEQVGLAYDSSLAWRDSIGFRRSLALPFYPWWSSARRALSALQFPMFCMDAHVLLFDTPSREDPLARLKECTRIIRQTGGLGVIDWHNRTSFPKGGKYQTWGYAYLELLDYLASDPEIWVTDLGSAYKWLESWLQKSHYGQDHQHSGC